MVTTKDEVASWVKLYTTDLFSYAVTGVSDEVTAEDIVQETFLSAMEAYPKFQHNSSPRTWLFSILKYRIADYYRHKYKQLQNIRLDDAADGPFDANGRLKAPCSSIQWRMEEDLLDNKEFLQALHQCIEALPQKMAAVVELKDLEGTDSRLPFAIKQQEPWQLWVETIFIFRKVPSSMMAVDAVRLSFVLKK